MATPEQTVPETPDTTDGPEKTVYVLHGQELASRSRRLGALAIDSAIVGLIVVMLFVGAVAGDNPQMPPESAGLLTVAFLIFYHILAWTAFSATPGKMILKLQIVDRNGWRIGIVQSIGRLFGYGISTLCVGLGFAWIFVSRFGRGWHDHIAGTYVVYLGHKESVTRDMAGDLYKDLLGGPPKRRDFAGQRSIEAANVVLAGDAQDQEGRRVRRVDVDHAEKGGTDRVVIGDYPVANFARRSVAFCLDLIGSLVTSLVALFVMSIWIPQAPPDSVGEDAGRQDAIRLAIIISLVFGYLVYPVMSNWMFKSTVGKKLMHLQVVGSDGQNADLSKLFARNICYLVSAPPLLMGFISVLFDDSSQGWHDKIADTYVTYTGEGRVSDQRATQRPRTTGGGRRRSDWPTE